MILGPNYIENMIKHLQPGKVVCATRIEPPLHPDGKEKIIMDFGQDFDSLNVLGFERYCDELQIEFKDQTTRGMFAPWILYKSDFQAIGGHDPLFAPFPYEDSDIFQRWIMAGYELVQSRDAFVYHLTCRGHRWNEQIGKDDEYYKIVSNRAARNYIRKWGSWIKNDEYQHPIIIPKYNIAIVVKSCTSSLLELLEPWCDRIYIDDDMQVLTTHYIDQEQLNTKFELDKRVFCVGYNDPHAENDVVVEIDAKRMTNQDFAYVQQLAEILHDSGEVGNFQLGSLTISVYSLETYEKNLINCK
jgi:hypothetical protein